MTRLISLLFAASLMGLGQQPPGLRIVVIDGENAVNVVQQKTAVAPVVEVRDRNDQPVAGAIVRFAIRNGKATFGGSKALVVTTNTAGRAAVTTLTPTGSGALQITATATFQGQTAAVTIAQTNAMTAAAAGASSGAGGSGASGAGAGGGAGGGGGGISATTVGIVGGAAAGAAVVATKLVGNSSGPAESTFRGTYSGLMTTAATSGPCTFDQQHSGTVSMFITIQDSGTVSGHATVDGMDVITRVGATCVGPVLGSAETYRCCDPNPAPTLTGTAQSLGFTGNHPGAPGVTWTYTFSGTISGSQGNGTLSLNIASVNAAGAATFPVTLTKQ